MANQFLTIKEVARQALPRLIENLVFPNLVYKDYSDTFQKRGDEIQIRKPAKLEAKEFDAAKGVEMQDIDDSQTVTVKLDKIATVDVEISALESALNIDNLNRQFIEPAAVALAQKINSDGLALYKDIPYVCGTPGTTPSKLEDITAVRKVLNANKVPTSGRRAVWDVEADAAFTTIPAIVNAEKSGSTAALREGSIGRLFGLDNYMSQAVKHHTAGTLSAAVKPKEATKAGTTQLTLAATAVTGALKKGDILTILGDTYVVTADAAAASNEITVPIYPALRKDVTTATNVTVAGNHTANLAFVAPAFAFVTRPLVTPAGVDCYTTSYNGISLRVTKGYDMKSISVRCSPWTCCTRTRRSTRSLPCVRWVDMWTVDFEFYRSTYGGAMEAESFPQAMRAACAYIDTLTFGRLRGAEEIPDDVQLAACAVADVYAAEQSTRREQMQRAGVKSFTTDGYSETLGDAAQLAKDFAQHRMDVAEIYLPRTHPLRYAGIR